MSLLTYDEITVIGNIHSNRDTSMHWDAWPAFARAIEAAVIARFLATVSVEPVAWGMQRPDGMVLDVIDNSEHNRHGGEYNLALYTAEALAAARVQAIEEAAKICECQWSTLEERDAGIEFAEAIRALIGGQRWECK